MKCYVLRIYQLIAYVALLMAIISDSDGLDPTPVYMLCRMLHLFAICWLVVIVLVMHYRFPTVGMQLQLKSYPDCNFIIVLWCYRALVLYLASVLDEARSFLSKYSKRRLGG